MVLKPNNALNDIPFGIVAGIAGYFVSHSIQFAMVAFAFGVFFSYSVPSGD